MSDDSLSFTVPLSGLAKSRRARVSLPKITALLDDPRYAASAEPTTPPTLHRRHDSATPKWKAGDGCGLPLRPPCLRLNTISFSGKSIVGPFICAADQTPPPSP